MPKAALVTMSDMSNKGDKGETEKVSVVDGQVVVAGRALRGRDVNGCSYYTERLLQRPISIVLRRGLLSLILLAL